ncbi:hypothetical protein N0B51_05435 [Tsuneonella sp. YG55]|uniref:Uncharacterized protein n=1 Tax=Tsuneonella litorea TaxID=2976475 RepID=A0A9X2W0L6_9SPHN|nr:hypothetical protein [Tsuneonella litorea]MCT2558418.1 hypothetical protein [Tsuneonella litorea]
MTTTSSSPADTLSIDIRSTGTSAPSETIAPQDQHFADAILAMDPMSLPNSNIQITPGLKLPELRVTGLPPGPERTEIETALKALPPEQRATRESAMVEAALRKMLPAIRSLTGAGEGATPYHQEQCLIAGEYRELARRLDAVEAELDEVGSYRAERDPQTGEAVAIPVPLYQGDSRSSRLALKLDLERRMRVLVSPDGTPGVEAKRRLGEAMRESVVLAKQRAEQLRDSAEANRLAGEMLRKERIEAQAKAIASVHRNTL